jgi:hypothetical protein
MKTTTRRTLAGLALAAAVLSPAIPTLAHHSFAPYDMDKVVVVTGVVTRVNPDANHLQIFYAPMNEERKNVVRGPDNQPEVWALEMTGSAQAAAQGISVSTFPPGTIFSAAMHPLRNGEKAGSRVNPGAIFVCPAKKPPAPGKHCDSVEGHKALGQGPLPAPKG